MHPLLLLLSAGLPLPPPAMGTSTQRVIDQPVAVPAGTADSSGLPLPPLPSRQTPAEGATESASGGVLLRPPMASQASEREAPLSAAGLCLGPTPPMQHSCV